MNKMILLAGLILSSAAQAAPSGADALLNSVSGGTSAMSMDKDSVHSDGAIQGEIRLDNAVARQLFTAWSSQKHLPYEANSWVQAFFSGKYETFAHLKTVMNRVAESRSESFQNAVESAYVYSLFRLNLPQSFVTNWLNAMESSSFRSSPASVALDEALMSAEPLDQWLNKNKILLTAAQEELIRRIGPARHTAWLNMNAYVLQRKGLAAEELLPKLAINSPFRPKLSMTVALAHAKKGDLGNAAKILKLYYEPWMNQSKDAVADSRYSMTIARLLYQAGSVDGAIQYYLKVPKGSDDYITAREELSWCWLRQGNISELRGNLVSLNSAVLSDQFRPESSLVKAISDLKMCDYAAAEKDFDQFVKKNKEWATKIDAAIAAPESTTPRTIDEYSQAKVDALKLQAAELAQLQDLANRSVSAALPAVGPQKHWTGAIQALKLTMETTKKRQAEEFRRQWKSDKVTLQEAIRKMQFVKVELLSQVSQFDSLTSKEPMPAEKLKEAKAKIGDQADHSFPFDGVLWPDELFKLKAVNDGQCAGKL